MPQRTARSQATLVAGRHTSTPEGASYTARMDGAGETLAVMAQDAAAPLAPGDAPWQLTDLIDVSTLQSIQDTFARAFGLPTVIINPDGTNATAITHRHSFCEDLTRTSRVAGPRCRDCDVRSMRAARATGEPSIFHCWNGLYDAAIPIAPKGHVLGYFLCGQVFTAPPDPQHYAATAEEIRVDPVAYVDALGEVRVLPYETYEASVRSMHVLAGMIAEQAAASIDSMQMLEDARRAREDTGQLIEELDAILEGLRDVGSQPDYQSTLQAVADNLARLIPYDSCVIYLADDRAEELVPAVVRDPYADRVAGHRFPKGHGVIGQAAVTGIARRLADMTREPEYRPIPGVPVEPESALVMPMVYDDTISGVIVLSRFERRTFTDHDLRVLGVFSSQASVSIRVARLASENAQRLREERALARLLRAVSSRTNVETLTGEAATLGLELLGADAAVVLVDAPGGGATTGVAGIAADRARALLDSLAAEIALCRNGEGSQRVVRDGRALLVLALRSADHELGTAVFRAPAAHEWDDRLATALSAQLSLGIERARMHERERRMLLEHRRLAELGTELVQARNADEVRERLLARTPDLLGADVSFVALLEGGPDAISVELRGRGRVERRTVKLDGGARVAAVRLRSEPEPSRSLFDLWSDEICSALAPEFEVASCAAEPLGTPTGLAGGLFVGWRSPEIRPSTEQRRVLTVVAGAAASALARFAVHSETDSSLRQRVVELEALTQLARRITGLAHERPIVDEVLGTLRRVGRLEGVAYGVRSGPHIEIRRSSGMDPGEVAELAELMDGVEVSPNGMRRRLGGREVLALPVQAGDGREAIFVAVGGGGEDAHRDRVLGTLVRYGGVALENAHLHDRQRDAIEALKRTNVETAEQYDQLTRILSVHETLGVAVLERQGLDTVARSLAGLLHGDLVIVARGERVLAAWPPEAGVPWSADAEPEPGVRSVHREIAGGHLLGAPAVVDGQVLAWVVARLPSEPGEIERAGVEYGALLTALDLLRERAALEVETRLRGGLLEDLFKGEFVDELIAERARAIGYDLSVASRVILIEPAAAEGDADGANRRRPVNPEVVHATVADAARGWSSANLVAVRGDAVVVVAPEQPGSGAGREPLEQVLRATLRRRLPQWRFVIGAGTACSAPSHYRRSFVAARRGVDLLRALGRDDDVFSFRDTSVESMLLQTTEPEVILEFIQRYVQPLDEYDSAHAASLRRTLDAYFEAGGNLEAAARALHVHVSTLRYRLKRISALLECDLKDPGAGLDIQVALRAARVLGLHAA
jgi:sugar diacid utilization regulator/ligand-binding sensor protein/putative methionine-R-sulfoxide reductase with GAF domain